MFSVRQDRHWTSARLTELPNELHQRQPRALARYRRRQCKSMGKRARQRQAAAQAVHAAIDDAARLFRVLDTYRAHFCCCGVPKGYVSSVLRKLEPMHRLLQAYRCLSARPLYIMIGGGLAASRQTVCSISGAAPARPAARQAVGRPLAAALGWRRALSSAAAGKQHASPSAATAAA